MRGGTQKKDNTHNRKSYSLFCVRSATFPDPPKSFPGHYFVCVFLMSVFVVVFLSLLYGFV